MEGPPQKNSEDLFIDSDSPEEIISTVLKKPTDPPGDGSNSDKSEDNKPPKLPPWSSKRPSAAPLKTKE